LHLRCHRRAGSTSEYELSLNTFIKALRCDGEKVIVPFAGDQVGEEHHSIACVEWNLRCGGWGQLWERVCDDIGWTVDKGLYIPRQRFAENDGCLRRPQ
jgi:hypothetical protein